MSFKTILLTIIFFIIAIFTILPASAQLELPKNCIGECPLIANPQAAIAGDESASAMSVFLGISRILAFLAVGASIILTPIGLIVSLILQFGVKKHAKLAWITTACLFGLFFVAIIGYTLIGLFSGFVSGDLSSAFGR